MIFKAKNGAEIIEKIAVSEEEALVRFPDINHALVVVKIEDDYLLGYHKWRDDWETFGGTRYPYNASVLPHILYRRQARTFRFRSIP